MRAWRGLFLGVGLVVAAAALIATGVSWSRITKKTTGPGSKSEATLWTCSMHPQVRLDKPGQCPICGMDLVPVAAPSRKGVEATPVTALAKAAGPRSKPEAGVWTCSMHPQVRLPGPGRCPICGMDLIPASKLSAKRAEREAVAGFETVPVTYRELAKVVRTVGKLDYNERRVAFIAARIAGRVDRLYADFTGITVKEGDHLVDIYSPELYSAQSELILALGAYERAQAGARAIGRDYTQSNIEAARTKLLLWGITPAQLAEIEKTRKIRTHLTIYAPIGGTIIQKEVRIGQYVAEGDLLYRIADLDPIWLYMDVYEYDIGWVRYGQAVDVALEAYPGETFRGTVTFIDPFLNDQTRAVRVRVNLPNADRRLKPAMYATASIRVRLRPDGTPEPTGMEGKYWCPMHPEVVRDGPGQCPICQMPLERVPEAAPPLRRPDLAHEGAEHAGPEHQGHTQETRGMLAIPVSAVLDTGQRKVAYRQTPDGNYEIVELEVGPRSEAADRDQTGPGASYYPVLKGLLAGDRVVVRGGFLLDSQRQIEGMPSLLFPQGQSAATLHAGHGSAAPDQPTPPTSGGHQH